MNYRLFRVVNAAHRWGYIANATFQVYKALVKKQGTRWRGRSNRESARKLLDPIKK